MRIIVTPSILRNFTLCCSVHRGSPWCTIRTAPYPRPRSADQWYTRRRCIPTRRELEARHRPPRRTPPARRTYLPPTATPSVTGEPSPPRISSLAINTPTNTPTDTATTTTTTTTKETDANPIRIRRPNLEITLVLVYVFKCYVTCIIQVLRNRIRYGTPA